ncbi:NUDIX domain-containing protein [Pikeienuella piscinae]|uniref:NUDIX domain-containing protein n=1 Tax=Pikeienuella piscinae TaxID=2748098 RepID=A0A7L5C179_9RHOB|nr:NUDIX domain-containing protein [Pikeienuella piscinae]QIE56878.1 NUDIX domain-containing protein [Pikeienuella piscinae]
MSEEAGFAPLGPWREPFDVYRGALVIPVDPAGRVLLQLRDRWAPVHPGEWGLFGGAVEGDETLLEAAMRELEEETGLRPPAAEFRPFARIVSADSRRRLYTFEARIVATPADIILGEGAGFGFFEREDMMRLDLVPPTRVLLAAWASSFAKSEIRA